MKESGVDLVCSKCGTDIEEDYFVNLEYCGGDKSKYVKNCCTIDFEICEKCYIDFARTLLHKPYMKDGSSYSKNLELEDVTEKKYWEENKIDKNPCYGC